MCVQTRCSAKTAISRIAAALVVLAGLGAGHSRAAGDPARGKSAFVRQCAICHTAEEGGPNRFGPNLFGVLHRKAGTVAGFSYSRAFKAAASWDWNEDLVAGWIAAPGVMVPGTAMGVFQGVAQNDRDDIVAYLAAQQSQ
jgi:cytochrome c